MSVETAVLSLHLQNAVIHPEGQSLAAATPNK